MKHKTWFRLMLKVLGVYFAASGITEFASSCFTVIYYYTTQPSNPQIQYWYLANALVPLMKIAVGAYLFFGGKWIADLAIPGNRPYCHECGYDLTGAAGCACNECGTPFRAAGTNP